MITALCSRCYALSGEDDVAGLARAGPPIDESQDDNDDDEAVQAPSNCWTSSRLKHRTRTAVSLATFPALLGPPARPGRDED